MRKLYVTLALSGFSLISFSQSITWSSEEVKPKEKNLFTNLAFPGADANNYYVNESEAGGVTFRNRKFKDYITVVDKNTLKVKTQVDLNAAFKDNDGDYLNAENFFFKDRKYYFFINRDNKEKNVYDVYCSIQQLEGDSPGELKVIQKVDRKKDKPFKDNYDPFADKEKEEGAAFSAAMYVNIKPAYDGNSIISAMVTETVDDNYSTLNLSEWDKDMKSIHSNNYKIPFLRRTIGTRSSMSNMGRLGEKPRVRDFAKDNNGFIYVLVYSADPKSPELRSQYYICQFKLSDPAYMKIYKNEINKNIASAGIGLHQDESGKLFFSNLGVEIEDEKDEKNYMWVNSAIIGSFNSQGEFVSIYTNRLSEEMMYHFEKEKKVNKEGKLETLNIVNILSGSDGGCYVIWQYHWTETANSGHAADTHYENALVQCYDNNNKMKWEKVIYKNHAATTSANIPGLLM